MGYENKLNVRMFGGFFIEYEGRPVTFPRSGSTKFVQLLQLLFLNQPQGMSKDLLLGSLYDRDSGVNNNKNLNNVIYRAKKQLLAAGLPEEDYIVLENGTCRWSSSFPVEVDVIKFEEKVEKSRTAEGVQRKLLLEEAEALCTGEFLPAFSTELWVIERSLKYKKRYEQVVQELGAILETEGDYNRELALYRKAAKIYPYDQWQMKEMDCLIAIKEYRSAYELYQNTARLYCVELGIPAGPEMIERLRKMERQMTHPVGDFEDIKEHLGREEGKGAYYCFYPSFLDSCHLLARTEDRTGRSLFLMLINLTDAKGREIKNLVKLEKQMELLKEVIKASFRQGDFFTTYSKSQYMIVLLGTEQENCGKAFRRCLERWKKMEGASGELSYSVEALTKLLNPGVVKQKEPPAWGKHGKSWEG